MIPTNPTQKRKEDMIQALKEQLGIISKACKQVGINRDTHYQWMKLDPEYKKRAEEIPELVLDFAENALYKLMIEGNPQATIFFLKTKGKSRGYIEKPETQITYNKSLITGPNYSFEVIRPDDNPNKMETQSETA